LHDQTLTVYAPGVLQNDNDPDFDSLSITSHTEPTSGSLTLNGDGSIAYIPNAGYVGSDSFTYTITDGIASATATVTIAVTNQAPIANDDSYSVLHDHTLTVSAPGVLTNDYDVDGDPRSISGHTDPSS